MKRPERPEDRPQKIENRLLDGGVAPARIGDRGGNGVAVCLARRTRTQVSAIDGKGGDHLQQRAAQGGEREVPGAAVLPRELEHRLREDVQLAREAGGHDRALALPRLVGE
jgi:hypothetical protein